MANPRFPNRHTIIFERTLAVSLQRAWEAITSKQDLDRFSSGEGRAVPVG